MKALLESLGVDFVNPPDAFAAGFVVVVDLKNPPDELGLPMGAVLGLEKLPDELGLEKPPLEKLDRPNELLDDLDELYGAAYAVQTATDNRINMVNRIMFFIFSPCA